MTGAHLDSVEELNLLGSEHYVGDLAENNPDALGDIALYLNFDMVGSPSFVRFVCDGDNSTGEGAEGPEGSPEIESIFSGYFERQGLASEGSGHHATGKTKLAARGQVHMHGHESAR